ncbi:MAG: rhodanese-like domain-containing protein [Kordiimonadaceae bacterium]|jgi:rhodanese-related sulfurtransferase|nr:rhodanese-like domain-containing protein [Kordiimonadaceae bacterium]
MNVTQISVNELSDLVNDGALLIDVRDPAEHTTARVPQAVSIPLSTVPDRLSEVPTDGPVYVICAKGGRSQMAVEFYTQQGVQAINVTGGTDAWLSAGFEHRSGPAGAER